MQGRVLVVRRDFGGVLVEKGTSGALCLLAKNCADDVALSLIPVVRSQVEIRHWNS